MLNYLAHIVTASGYLLIVGEFNLHVDSQTNAGRRFTGLLHSFNLRQHVNGSTHKNGHTLDLVITREEPSFIKNLLVFDPALSDHFMIRCNLDFSKPVAQDQMTYFRRLRAIDIDKFSSDLEDSTLIRTPLNNDLSLAIDQFNSTLQSIIDNHAPIIRRSVALRPYATWFTDELKAAKIRRRKLERRWRAHNSEANHQLYTEHCRVVNDLIRYAKENHFSSIIESNQGDQKILFQAVNNLLYRKPIVLYPSVGSDMAIAEKFKSFFIEKIRRIRDSLPVHNTGFMNDLYLDNSATQSWPCEFVTFQHVSTDLIANFIESSRVKTCALDPLPASVLTKCLPRLLPVITDIVNRSLDDAFIPKSLKTALIIPLLKKTNLDTEDFKNFRPVSNLPFVSKLIEKLVAVQLVQCIDDNNLDEKFQSAYKKLHSTETALLRVHDDILRAVDRGCTVVLLLLELSAAFDTVDHGLLLHRLTTRFGIKGKVLAWFKSYLTDRSQFVGINGSIPLSLISCLEFPRDPFLVQFCIYCIRLLSATL